MLNIEELKALEEQSTAAVRAVEASVEKLNALIAHHEKDSTRSRSFVVEQVKAEREKALPAIADTLKTIQAVNKEAAGQKRFWESKALLMSQQAFSDDPAKDAVIKSFWRSNLETMPSALLQLTYENARFDGDLALVWSVFSIGSMRGAADATVAGALNMTLDGIEVPDQAAALASISVCWSNVDYAEMVFAVASGLRADPVRKMNVGRQQQVTSKLVTAAAGIEGRFVA